MRVLIQKFFYGQTELGIQAADTFIRLHLLVFYSKVLGLPLMWIGAALGISLLWEAAIDPLIGRFSDDFHGRYGTRMHLILAGAIGTALSLTALYSPPALESLEQKWFYLLILSLVFHTSLSLISIPFSALPGDFSSETREQSHFVGWRYFFLQFGTLLGIVIPGTHLASGDNKAYSHSSWLIAMLVLLTGFLVSLFPQRKSQSAVSTSPPARHPLPAVFKNASFILLWFSFVAVQMGLALNSTMALYYYRMNLQLDEKDIQNALILFFVALSLSVPFWLSLSAKAGRKMTLLAGLSLCGILSSWMVQWIPAQQSASALLIAAGGLGFLSGVVCLMDLLVFSSAARDSGVSVPPRYGLYFGVWKFGLRLSKLSALLLAGFLLDWANVAFPDPDTNSRLSLIFGPGVGFFFLLAAFFILPSSFPERVNSTQAARGDALT